MEDAERKRDLIFVYGTLRRGHDNPMSRLLLEHANPIGYGSLNGKLFLIGRYPGAIISNENNDWVKGEVYALRDSDDVLEHLDRYERCYNRDVRRSLFIRVRAEVVLESSEKVFAWVYTYNRSTDGCRLIPSGDYFQA
jgi:gamma-glutamylcyclotransferase (GGCT)/AIG2-like uncharacterized protein YtfP